MCIHVCYPENQKMQKQEITFNPLTVHFTLLILLGGPPPPPPPPPLTSQIAQ